MLYPSQYQTLFIKWFAQLLLLFVIVATYQQAASGQAENTLRSTSSLENSPEAWQAFEAPSFNGTNNNPAYNSTVRPSCESCEGGSCDGESNWMPWCRGPDGCGWWACDWWGWGDPIDFQSWRSLLGLRHSCTHGPNIGLGRPLRGTSWLNRPYHIGGSFGTMVMAKAVNSDIRRDNDWYGDIHLGWDVDHYWGGEYRLGWSTPELPSTIAPNTVLNPQYLQFDYRVLYYPWGDAKFRPFVSGGMGVLSLNFGGENGVKRKANLLTFPLSIGMKYQHRRSLVWRTELVDNIAVGDGFSGSLHNVTFTIGAEWRFGVHPKSYWPWNPSRHHW